MDINNMNASDAEVVHPLSGGEAASLEMGGDAVSGELGGEAAKGGAGIQFPAGAAGDEENAENAPPQEGAFRVFATKNDWQAEIDRIIGKRLGENRRAFEAAKMLDEFGEIAMRLYGAPTREEGLGLFARDLKGLPREIKLGAGGGEAMAAPPPAARISELGMGRTSPALVRGDASRLPDGEFDALLERALSGETIKI